MIIITMKACSTIRGIVDESVMYADMNGVLSFENHGLVVTSVSERMVVNVIIMQVK